MPAKKQKYSEVKNVRWITVRGRRIPVKPGADKLSAIKENVKNFQPEGGGKDPAKAKNYEKSVVRPEAPSRVGLGDMVVFDEYTKVGHVIGSDGVNLSIMSPQSVGGSLLRHPDSVFKADELIGGDYHWDHISDRTRFNIVRKAGVADHYVQKSWYSIPEVIQNQIQKGYGPTGGDIEAETAGIWNPVSGDVPLYKRLKEEDKPYTGEDDKKDNMEREKENNGDSKEGKEGDKESGGELPFKGKDKNGKRGD